MSTVWRTGALVGHRGVRLLSGVGENTVAAFERALDDGADAVELDVRLCATGEVVVFHDPDLKRATDGKDKREVRLAPYVELGSMHLFGATQGVPLLRDVLSLALNRGVGVNVEMKHDSVDRPRLIRAVASELDRGNFDVLVSSFDPRMLAQLKARRPETRIAVLTTHERKWTLPLARLASRFKFLDAVHLERVQASEHVIGAIKSHGCRVGVWTVNDPEEARVLRAHGADWIITDDAHALRDSKKT